MVRIREAMARYEQSFVGGITQEAYEDMQYALERIEKRVDPPKDD